MPGWDGDDVIVNPVPTTGHLTFVPSHQGTAASLTNTDHTDVGTATYDSLGSWSMFAKSDRAGRISLSPEIQMLIGIERHRGRKPCTVTVALLLVVDEQRDVDDGALHLVEHFGSCRGQILE